MTTKRQAKAIAHFREPIWDHMAFHPLPWPEWRERWQAWVGVAWWPGKVKVAPRTGLKLLDDRDIAFFPYYEDGKNWLDGEHPTAVRPGDNTALVRVPALRLPHANRFIDHFYLILDGRHRIAELRPAMVILDWMQPGPSDYRYFLDLSNEVIKGLLAPPPSE